MKFEFHESDRGAMCYTAALENIMLALILILSLSNQPTQTPAQAQPPASIPAKAPSIDTLRTQGHAHYAAHEYEPSEETFRAMLALAQSPRDRAEAYRMLAQISMNRPDTETTIQLLELAWEQAKLDDPKGLFSSTRSVLGMLCSLTKAADRHEDTVRYAQEGIAAFPWDARATLLYASYEANKALGDKMAAIADLTELLDGHLKYTTDKRLSSLEPAFRLETYEMRGEGWECPSDQFLRKARDICGEPEYLFSLSRLTILARLARHYEQTDRQIAAIELRTDARAQLLPRLEELAQTDPFLPPQFRVQLAQLALDDARAHFKLGQHERALAVLDETLALDTGMRPDIERHALALGAKIRRTQEDH